MIGRSSAALRSTDRRSTASRPGKATMSAGLLLAVAALTLSGCAGHGSDSGGQVSKAVQPAKSVSPLDADQIEGAVNDAQSTLDGLDHDFADDDTATN
jgi:hypothetical protein